MQRIALFFTLMVMAHTPAAHACDCAPMTRQEAFDHAEIVFTGRALGEEAQADHNLAADRFMVEEVLKSSAPLDKEITILQEYGDCMAGFARDKSITVYAHTKKNASGIPYITTHQCMNTIREE